MVPISITKRCSQSSGSKIPITGPSSRPVINTGYIIVYPPVMCQVRQVKITFEKQKTDPRGRWLGYVWLPDGSFLNAQIVAEGFGFLDEKAPMREEVKKELEESQAEARKAKLGVWGDAVRAGNLLTDLRERGPGGATSSLTEEPPIFEPGVPARSLPSAQTRATTSPRSAGNRALQSSTVFQANRAIIPPQAHNPYLFQQGLVQKAGQPNFDARRMRRKNPNLRRGGITTSRRRVGFGFGLGGSPNRSLAAPQSQPPFRNTGSPLSR